HFQAEFGSFGGLRGGFQFLANQSGLGISNTGNTATGNTGYVPQVWNGLAGFVLGMPIERQRDTQEIQQTGREWQLGYYLNDHWTVSDKFTLNVGLRFESYPLMKRADSGIERLDYTTYTVLLGGRGGVPEDVGIHHQKLYV